MKLYTFRCSNKPDPFAVSMNDNADLGGLRKVCTRRQAPRDRA